METKNGDLHRNKAIIDLQEKLNLWSKEEAVLKEVKLLNTLRLSVFRDEISQSPRGQILEPGFRVIFPLKGESSRFRLT
jgi:hypothetical protein